MKRYRGHFYNWYDTLTLEPMLPLYVSTVDSGNLAGLLLTFRQGILELPDQPLLGTRAFDGLGDMAFWFCRNRFDVIRRNQKRPILPAC